MKLEICGAKATQTAVPELNQNEKTLYYLIIGEDPDKVVINVGQKTYEKIAKLTEKEHGKNLKPAGMPKPTGKITTHQEDIAENLNKQK